MINWLAWKNIHIYVYIPESKEGLGVHHEHRLHQEESRRWGQFLSIWLVRGWIAMQHVTYHRADLQNRQVKDQRRVPDFFFQKLHSHWQGTRRKKTLTTAIVFICATNDAKSPKSPLDRHQLFNYYFNLVPRNTCNLAQEMRFFGVQATSHDYQWCGLYWHHPTAEDALVDSELGGEVVLLRVLLNGHQCVRRASPNKQKLQQASQGWWVA